MISNFNSSSIVDIGCGLGEYLNFFKKFYLSANRYLWVACEEFMIKIAKNRFKDNAFIQCNILENKIPEADYLICSGTLNIFTSDRKLF